MIVVDTSGFLALAKADSIDPVLTQFDVHTTTTVSSELMQISGSDDTFSNAAQRILTRNTQFNAHPVDDFVETSRIGPGEGSCLKLVNDLDANFLVTDNHRALPELRNASDAEIVTPPVVLKALVYRQLITDEEARDRIARIVDTEDWLATPLYRRAENLFNG